MKIISFPFWENIVNNGEQVEGDFLWGQREFQHGSLQYHSA